MELQELLSGKSREWERPQTPVWLQWKRRKAQESIFSCIKLALDTTLFVNIIKEEEGDFLALSHSLFAGSIWGQLYSKVPPKNPCHTGQLMSNQTQKSSDVNKGTFRILSASFVFTSGLFIVLTEEVMTIVTAANKSTTKPVYFHKPSLRSQFSCIFLPSLHPSELQARTGYERKVTQHNL